MTVKEIIEKYLKNNNYDGLYNSDIDCGCELNGSIPCDDMTAECQCGYKIIVTENNKEKYEDLDVGVGDWIISAEKEAK